VVVEHLPFKANDPIARELRNLRQALAGDAKNGALGASIGAIEHVSPMEHVPYTGEHTSEPLVIESKPHRIESSGDAT